MLENADKQSCGEGADGSDVDYLLRAKDACARGDAVLGMHLYLTAFEKAAGAAGDPSPEAVDALKILRSALSLSIFSASSTRS